MYYIWFDKSAILQAESKTTAAERVTKINAIIDGLLDAQIAFAADPNKQEYGMDDGQTKIKMVYRSLDALAMSIAHWERVKQMYVNRYNGRMMRLMDSRNFPNWYNLIG